MRMRLWMPLLAVAAAACAPLPPASEAPSPAREPATASSSDVGRAIALHRARARELRAAGDHAGAAVEWQILALLAPQDPEHRRELEASQATARRGSEERLDAGRAAQRSGQTERAIQAYLQALALDPRNDEAARALRELDRQKYARIAQDRAARARPDTATALATAPAPAAPRTTAGEPAGDGYDVEQALEMLAAGDVAGGLRDLRAWVDANPRQRAARQRIGTLVADKAREFEVAGARETALAVYETAATLRGDTPPDWAARIAALKRSVAEELYEAGAKAARSDLKLAIAKWEACLRLDPQHARAAARLSEARQMQDRLQRMPKDGRRR